MLGSSGVQHALNYFEAVDLITRKFEWLWRVGHCNDSEHYANGHFVQCGKTIQRIIDGHIIYRWVLSFKILNLSVRDLRRQTRRVYG